MKTTNYNSQSLIVLPLLTCFNLFISIANGALLIQIDEIGGDVVVNYSGTIDVSGLASGSGGGTPLQSA